MCIRDSFDIICTLCWSCLIWTGSAQSKIFSHQCGGHLQPVGVNPPPLRQISAGHGTEGGGALGLVSPPQLTKRSGWRRKFPQWFQCIFGTFEAHRRAIKSSIFVKDHFIDRLGGTATGQSPPERGRGDTRV